MQRPEDFAAAPSPAKGLFKRKRILLWCAVGLLLRVLFIVFPRPGDDDLDGYLELGRNLIHHGIYGFGQEDIGPSLIRMPGYPIIVASLEMLFHNYWWYMLLTLQIVADLSGGILLAHVATRHLGGRCGETALALAMFCPLTAAYTGIGMTESFSLFAISLGIYAIDRASVTIEVRSKALIPILLAGFASALAMMLRPDGLLLFLVLAAALLFTAMRARDHMRAALASTLLFTVIALLPTALWTLRNWNAFHVFEPLAPRRANDPGERVNYGFYRWVGTWSTDYTTSEIFWSIGSEEINENYFNKIHFDSPEEQQKTFELIRQYNQHFDITPQMDSEFNALAAERIQQHPLRRLVGMPMLRVLDMSFRPRTQAFSLPIEWWNWHENRGKSLAALALGLINLGYVLFAVWGFVRGRVPWAWMLLGYVILRCLVISSMENPEPRYTLEFYPVLFLAGASALAERRKVSIEE